MESDADKEAADETAVDDGGKNRIICKGCGHPITAAKFRTERNGKQLHTFFNPQGILFEIGCFVKAPGCMVQGAPTTEFSWFPGYAWHYAHCGNCLEHLGWQFLVADGQGGFFGLILPKLIEKISD